MFAAGMVGPIWRFAAGVSAWAAFVATSVPAASAEVPSARRSRRDRGDKAGLQIVHEHMGDTYRSVARTTGVAGSAVGRPARWHISGRLAPKRSPPSESETTS